MRRISMREGAELPLDGDILGILEALYREISVRSRFRNTYEGMMLEIRHIVDSMTESERRDYLVESLFLNVVRYENERLTAFLKNVETAEAGSQTGSQKGPDR